MQLFLSGDLMPGRGIDQILAQPSDPAIEEPWAKSALDYVRLAESTTGPLPRHAAPDYIWGDALEELQKLGPDARIVNLETAITRCNERTAKGINYRMSPVNAACLGAARIDCCVLANNHVLDWGRKGLLETLDTLHGMGLRTAGAGRNAAEAAEPARLVLPGGQTLLVAAYGLDDAGVPRDWAATAARPGVNRLPDLSPSTLTRLAEQLLAVKRTGDLMIVSLHWGSNWGYSVTHEQRRFARGLIDAGAADLVHGHSSHHPRPMEIHRGRLILYGCGDLLNDYEGILGYESYRPELTLMYFAELNAAGTLERLTLCPMRLRHFRLNRANDEEAQWLADRMRLISGLDVKRDTDGRLRLG